jgi:hypothetical protein
MLVEQMGFTVTKVKLNHEAISSCILDVSLRISDRNLQRTLFNYFTSLVQRNLAATPSKLKYLIVNEKID